MEEYMETMKKVFETMKKYSFFIELGIVILTCGIGLVYMSNLTVQIKDLEEYRISLIENYSELEELYTTASEIKTLYEKYGITEDIDFEYCTDVALTYFTNATKDTYGTYLRPEDTETFKNKQDEMLVGIGVQVVYEEGKGSYVSIVYDESPADKSGIRVGDYLVKANGIHFKDADYLGFIDMIKGEPGSSVEITYTRDNKEYTVQVVRENVSTHSVRHSEIDDNTAYLKIDSFTFYTNTEFKDAMTHYKNRGFENYIIDLRDNTGGVLDTVVDMIDFMVPEGLIVKTVGKTDESYTEYYSDSLEFNGSIVVLVNEYSASASELFVQSMKDYNKATVIGEQTYGKGTVITQYELENGGTLVLSTALYYTKSETAIEGIGVTPDIKVSLTPEQKKTYYKLPLSDDPQFQMALRQFEKS